MTKITLAGNSINVGTLSTSRYKAVYQILKVDMADGSPAVAL